MSTTLTAGSPRDRLLPCASCGAEGTVEIFTGEHIAGEARLWLCANTKLKGGDCPDPDAYFSADAWNTRQVLANPPVPADVAQLRRECDGADMPAGYYTQRIDKIIAIYEARLALPADVAALCERLRDGDDLGSRIEAATALASQAAEVGRIHRQGLKWMQEAKEERAAKEAAETRETRLLGAFLPDAVKVLCQLGDGEWVRPASSVALDLGMTDKRVREIHHALAVLGFAQRGTLMDEGKVCGSGYWATVQGEVLIAALANASDGGER